MPNATKCVVCLLLVYAIAHPSASDGAAGILRWWFDPREEIGMDALMQALDWLIDRGAFAAVSAADGSRRYRRRGSAAELTSLLSELHRTGSRDGPGASGDTGR